MALPPRELPTNTTWLAPVGVGPPFPSPLLGGPVLLGRGGGRAGFWRPHHATGGRARQWRAGVRAASRSIQTATRWFATVRRCRRCRAQRRWAALRTGWDPWWRNRPGPG